MKRTLHRFGLLLAAAVAALCTQRAAAQEFLHEELRFSIPDSLSSFSRRGADSLSFAPHAFAPEAAPPVAWHPALREPLLPSVRRNRDGLPEHIRVINNIILQLGGYVNLTNGQAWIWGPPPGSYLDARTLSLPLP